FQVIAAAASVEYGRALGGTINAITKRGANDFQGSVFYFQRPGSLEARAPGGVETTSMRQHQFGATAGGAILKDRLFYFVAVERLDLRNQNVVTIDPFVAQMIRSSGFSLETGSLPTQERATSIFARLDFTQNATSQWMFSVAQGTEFNDNQIPWGGLVARSSGGSRETANLSLALTHQWQPTSQLINEVRILHTTRDNRLRSLDENGTVQVELQGTAIFGTQRLTPQDTLTTYQQLVDTLTWISGKHTVKAGVDLMATHNRGRAQQNFGGYYVFAALPPLGINTPLEAFLAPNPFGGTGLPAAFVQAFGSSATSFRTDAQSVFLQDEWQLHPRFQLRVGLRYERERIPTFTDAPDYAALANPPAIVDPTWGPVRLPDGPYAYSSLLRPTLNWTGSHLLPRVSFNWQVGEGLRIFGSMGSYAGSTNLAPVFGTRVINGRDQVGIMRTIYDPIMQGPWIAWASADGLAANRRYTTPPPGSRVITIPGEYHLPLQRQESLGAEWSPRPGMRLSLDLLHGKAEGLMNVRDVNAVVNFGGLPRRPDLR
ncbi:MAG: TonB-dependent receptor, partial [Holophaga sp.]|nr:TonB-dependent receptor [Holophaga sp.]